MPRQERHKTNYPGVYYIIGKHPSTGKPEKIYYITYRKNGKPVEEKAGRQYVNDMTPARAARLRTDKINGRVSSNKKARNAPVSSFNDLFDKYVNSKDYRSKDKDKWRYNRYIKSYVGHVPIVEVHHRHIVKILEVFDYLSPQSKAHIVNLIKRVFNWGRKHDYCKVILEISPPKVNNLKTEDLTPEQFKALMVVLDASSNQRIANIMRMALYTGMRKNEIVNLQWNDIDFEKKFIKIRSPKSGQDETIPLNGTAESLILKQERISDHIFCKSNGEQYRDIKDQVKKVTRAAGLPEDFRPMHGLRHVYASMVASSGKVDLYTLQKLLTHKSPRMTQRYAHLRDEALKKAAQVVDGLFDEMVE